MKIWLSLLSLSIFSFTSAHADIKTLEQNLKTKYPEIEVKSVQNSPIKDVYEVYMGVVLSIPMKKRNISLSVI